MNLYSELVGTYGRIGRLGYLVRQLVVVVLYAGGISITVSGAGGLAFIGLILMLGALVIGFCSTLRRMHDFNWNGAQMLLLLIPLVNIVVTVMVYFRPGDSDGNDHSIPPLGIRVSK